MTRSFRAMRFPRVFLLSIFAASLPFLAPMQALADPYTASAVASGDPAASESAANDAAESLSDLTALDTMPSIEKPLHRFYCVEYARLRSGLEIFGNAKTWWRRARNIYSEFTWPAAHAVMVFAGSRRIRLGHVAVVTAVVSPREIRVDQANWENRGEIEKNTPVLDVSRNNDWSRVRVWDIRAGQFGGHVYAIKGFIARSSPTGS